MDMSTLPKASDLSLTGERAPHWSPALSRQDGVGPLHSEVFASSDEASGAACAVALLLDDLRLSERARLEERPLLWVQDEASVRLVGRPYRHGLPPVLRRRVIHAIARTPQDALFALEEGVRCRDLAGVIGEIVGNPGVLDFTASRRLSLAVEKHRVPLYLVRLDAVRDLSSARMRWQVRSFPSGRPRWNANAPGHPAWHSELFRTRVHAPGEWILRDDGQSLSAERHGNLIQDNDLAPYASTSSDGDMAGAAGAGSLAAR